MPTLRAACASKMVRGKIHLLSVLLGFAMWVAPTNATDFSCGPQDLGFYPHPSSCTQFLGCVYGQQYSMDCPSGLHFNPTLRQCDWPASAACVLPPAPVTQTSPCIGCDPSSLCPPHVAYYKFPDWTNCSNYYICTQGVVAKVTCPPDLHYHFVQWSCARQDDAPCFLP